VTRPGLAKARAAPFAVAARRLFVQTSSDPPWRELFERADVVSEGGARDEPQGRIWYGSTSLVLPGSLGGPDTALLAALASRSVHVRLRAMRVAHREASLRAPGRLGRLVCEIHISPAAGGVRIDVDVQAPLIERRAVAR
jgi:hypothetical protein